VEGEVEVVEEGQLEILMQVRYELIWDYVLHAVFLNGGMQNGWYVFEYKQLMVQHLVWIPAQDLLIEDTTLIHLQPHLGHTLEYQILLAIHHCHPRPKKKRRVITAH
jgi:hypothetical protein